MKIGADLHKVICCVFLASRFTQCQVSHVKLSSVNSVVSKCPASIIFLCQSIDWMQCNHITW